MLICIVIIGSLHQARDHRDIYMAGFLLFRGLEAAAGERPGLDTGSPSPLTAPLSTLSLFIRPVVSNSSSTLQFPSHNYLWNFLGVQK